MRVYAQELKKILRPAPLLLLAAFVMLYGYLTLYSYHKELSWPPSKVGWQIARDVMDLCGESLESGELERAYAVLDERYQTQLDEHIRQSAELRALGVTDYKGFCQWRCNVAAHCPGGRVFTAATH